MIDVGQLVCSIINLIKQFFMICFHLIYLDINNGLGARTGKIKSAEKFDSAFFAMLSYLAHSMDSMDITYHLGNDL